MGFLNDLFIEAYDGSLKRLLRAVFASKVELSSKQDAINDLATIRSGAAAGATAVQPSVMNTALVNTVAESGVYDVTVNNSGATFASLNALLSAQNLDTLIPVAKRKGGMSIKFVQSSDNNYLRYNLKTTSFSTDPDDWEIAGKDEELEERVEDLEENAVMTGSYDATVAVGLADNLRGDDVVSAEFCYRKTGGSHNVGSGIAAIKEMRGKSLVWNQLISKQTSTITSNGITFVGNGDGTITVNGTATANSSIVLYYSAIVNHKYLYKGCPSGGNPGTYCITSTYLTTPQDVGNGAIWNATSTNFWLSIRISKGTTVNNLVFKPLLFDLTLMFGAGNEPTLSEFEKMFPLAHYDYNTGEIIGNTAEYIESVGFNQYNSKTGKAKVLKDVTYYVGGTYTSLAYSDGTAITVSSNLFTADRTDDITVTGGNATDTIINISNTDRNGTYEPYEKHVLSLDVSKWKDKQGNLVFPYGGMHGVGNAYDYAEADADGYIRNAVRVYERRAYESGDVTSGNIMTDGRTYTIYPLAEPVEVELATPVYAKYLVDKDGTEEITPANGTNPYTAPANLSILYAMDARGEIKNLPKNYLSKESAENMLNAMVSAGVIKSYTMTYDAANARYVFTFVKA